MSERMNTWLIGFSVDIDGIDMAVPAMVVAESLEVAEAGVMMMGRTWWDGLQKEDNGHRWQYRDRVVWFNSIILLDDTEVDVLRGLKFLDAWCVTGKAAAPIICDEYGNDWRDISR